MELLTPILSEGTDLACTGRRACRRGGNAEWSSAQDAEDGEHCRGFGRAYEIRRTLLLRRRLNSAIYLGGISASGVARQVFDPQWGRSVTPTTKPWDESFFSTLEAELLSRRRFASQAEAKMAASAKGDTARLDNPCGCIRAWDTLTENTKPTCRRHDQDVDRS